MASKPDSTNFSRQTGKARRPAEENNGPECRAWRRRILEVFVFQAIGLALAAWRYRHALNPDAISYLRIASYYGAGNTRLAISGYWSPLLSWLLVPVLKLGLSPLVAARIVMAVSGVVFLGGTWRVLNRFGVSQSVLLWGLWTAALISIPWSVENITPDLMGAGLAGFALAETVSTFWVSAPRAAFVCGLCWGIAYLDKSVYLPMAVLTSIGLAALRYRDQKRDWRLIVRSVALTFAGIALVVSPWIGVISVKCGELTFSRSARYNHTLIGPPEIKRNFAFDDGYAKPEPGRITNWEDIDMSPPDWSPIGSLDNALFQIFTILYTVPKVVTMLTNLFLGFPVLLAATVWSWCHPWRRGDLPGRFWRAMLPIAVVGGLYLPNYLLVQDRRYFYVTFPFLFVAAAEWLAIQGQWLPAWIKRHSLFLLSLAFVVPAGYRNALDPAPDRTAGECAWQLARRFSDAHLAGTIAGNASLPGGRTGLYLAFLINQPWYGGESQPSPASLRASGANLIVLERTSDVAREVAQDPAFQNLDRQLFSSAQEARRFPVEVFRNLSSE